MGLEIFMEGSVFNGARNFHVGFCFLMELEIFM